jgi:hypothetical protein
MKIFKLLMQKQHFNLLFPEVYLAETILLPTQETLYPLIVQVLHPNIKILSCC